MICDDEILELFSVVETTYTDDGSKPGCENSPRAEISRATPELPTPSASCRAVPQDHAKPRPIATRSNLRPSSYSSEVAYSSVSAMFYLRGD